MRKIKLGILGMGPRGIWFGIKRMLESDPRSEIAAICDRDPLQLDYAIQQTGIHCKQYRDLGELLADAEIEAVINCTDDPDHLTTSIQILVAKKALYLRTQDKVGKGDNSI